MIARNGLSTCCILIVLIALIVGCGGGERSKPKISRKSELMSFAIAYHDFYAVEDRAPANIDEFADYISQRGLEGPFAAIPQLIDEVRAGSLVFQWDVVLFESGDRSDEFVLGYEKSVEDSAGLVVMGGGFVQRVTADEFAKLPKLPRRQPTQ